MVDHLERTFPHQPHLRGWGGHMGFRLWALSDKELEGHLWVCWDPPACAHFRPGSPPATCLQPGPSLLDWSSGIQGGRLSPQAYPLPIVSPT